MNMVPGNALVPVEVAEKQGLPLYDTVTVRKLKLNQSTEQLADENGFKSRHSANGAPHTQAGRQMRDESVRPSYAGTADEMMELLFLADTARRDRECTQGDVGNAYPHGKRDGPMRHRAMRIPKHLRMADDEGRELCVLLGPPIWGEHDSGMWWWRTFHDTITQMGWREGEGTPCLYYFIGDKASAAMITKTDDFLISESQGSLVYTNATFDALRKAGLTIVRTDVPTSFDGMSIERDRRARELKVSMPAKVQEMIDVLEPGFEGTGDDTGAGLPAGQVDLRAIVDALRPDVDAPPTDATKEDVAHVQQSAGYFRFLRRVHPGISVQLHRLSCCALAPPAAARKVTRSVRRWLARRKYRGLIYGRCADGKAELGGSMYADLQLEDGAPAELAASADSTFGTYDLIAYGLTYYGAVVDSCTKRVGVESEGSMHTEGIASVRASDRIMYARNILTVLGVPPTGPTLLVTDSKAGMLVINNSGSSARSRHYLRMYRILQQRIGNDHIRVKHVPDCENPADVMTKWVDKSKFERCIAYLSGERRAPS